MQQVSKRGAAFGAAHEAVYLYAYPDPGTNGDPWTCGIGHTSRAGPPTVKRGDRWSLDKCFQVYGIDIGSRFAPGVRKAIKVPLKQHEFDALTSFHLNTGAVGTGSVDDKLNRGDRAGAIATWRQYNKAGGRVMKGLVTRRGEETELFLTGRYPSRKILLRESPTAPIRYILPENIPWSDVPAAAPVPAAPAVVSFDRPLPPPVSVAAKPPAATLPNWFSAALKWIAGT
jgi:GH24 family phage-related lysozyme (muramidase)